MKIYLYSILLVLIASCSSDDLKEETPVIKIDQSIQESHFGAKSQQNTFAENLSWNSFIVGEVLRLYPEHHQTIQAATNPLNKTVQMEALLNPSTNAVFLERYIFVASHAIMNYSILGNPDPTKPWPPSGANIPIYGEQSKSYFDVTPIVTGNSGILSGVNQLIFEMKSKRVELYIPNSYQLHHVDILTVGHPLIDVITNTGCLIYDTPKRVTYGFLDGYIYSKPATVNNDSIRNNHFIILSRPAAVGNNLSILGISFNIYTYLNLDSDSYTLRL